MRTALTFTFFSREKGCVNESEELSIKLTDSTTHIEIFRSESRQKPTVLTSPSIKSEDMIKESA